MKARDIDMSFISHLHFDHTGGFGPLRVSAGPVFLAGYSVENALAINVEGKGIVPGALFDERVHAIVGGLHLPV